MSPTVARTVRSEAKRVPAIPTGNRKINQKTKNWDEEKYEKAGGVCAKSRMRATKTKTAAQG